VRTTPESRRRNGIPETDWSMGRNITYAWEHPTEDTNPHRPPWVSRWTDCPPTYLGKFESKELPPVWATSQRVIFAYHVLHNPMRVFQFYIREAVKPAVGSLRRRFYVPIIWRLQKTFTRPTLTGRKCVMSRYQIVVLSLIMLLAMAVIEALWLNDHWAQKCVKHGAAEWVIVDETTGRTQLMWKDELPDTDGFFPGITVDTLTGKEIPASGKK